MRATAYIHAAGGIGSNAAPVLDFQAAQAASLGADAEPLALRELGKALGIAMPRLGSRFAELAVIGARSCVNRLERALPPTTPVYLATGLGDIARTDALYYQVMPPVSEMASPAQFATSGNNMAAFFVAQQVGLVSRNLTIAQQDLALERALSLALNDLACDFATAALVGGVDETTLPREFYVRRFPLSADKCIGEGSAWLALATQFSGAIGELIGVAFVAAVAEEDDSRWAQRTTRAIWCFLDRRSLATVMLGERISDRQAAALRICEPKLTFHDYREFTGCLPTAVAIALVSTFASERGHPMTYVHINRDASGRTGFIAWRVYGNNRRIAWNADSSRAAHSSSRAESD